MNSNEMNIETGLNVIKGCLITTLPGDINENNINTFKNDVLHTLEDRKITAVIVDFCSIKIIDRFEFKLIIDMCKMCKLLGSEAAIVGLQPEVVTLIVDLDINLSGIETFLNLEEGIDYFLEKSVDDKKERTDDAEEDNNQENEKEL